MRTVEKRVGHFVILRTGRGEKQHEQPYFISRMRNGKSLSRR